MMYDSRRPRDRRDTAHGPPTLSLPTIPSPPRTGESGAAPTRTAPPRGRKRGQQPAADSRALVAAPPTTMGVQVHSVRPLGTLNRLPLPPERSVGRVLLWQGALVVIAIVAVFITISGGSVAKNAAASPFAAPVTVRANLKVVDRVPIQTQIDPTIGYKDTAQYKAFSLASCSAAASSSVLLAWGDPNGRVGQVISDMSPFLTPAGLQSSDGFLQLGAKHNFNVIFSTKVTAGQIAELVTVQGIPVIVGIRDDYDDYYRYFAPGHYLVIVGADANGFQVVDNSTYFVHYLPTATFMQLWVLRKTIIFTPKSYPLPLVIGK
ncbi:MAG: hypothetical protein H0X24_11970 [Ktedonobacterales bacterium]|nr:hypothetical protein [Ktedonobacterales bacterium]